MLRDCLPVKLRAPSLNAKDGQIAIEEAQIAYASMTVEAAGGAGLSASVGLGLSVGGGIEASLGAEVSFG